MIVSEKTWKTSALHYACGQNGKVYWKTLVFQGKQVFSKKHKYFLRKKQV
jgi:hypothetical protein